MPAPLSPPPAASRIRAGAAAARPRARGLCGWPLAVLAWLCLIGSAQAALNLDVRIEGVKGELLDNVKAYLTVEQQRADPALDEGRLRRYHQKATKEIAEALAPFGYYQSKTSASLSEKDGQWTARYEIEPGPPVRVTEVNITLEGGGEQDPDFQKLVRDFPLHRDDVLDQREYKKGKESFQRFANERGYFDFKFTTHELLIDPAANTAEVHLYMNSGPRYHFGEVIFHQDILRDDFVRRFVQFQPGSPYQVGKLLDLQSALFDSDYFANVEIEPKQELAEDRRVPIDVNLTPRPQHRYTVGAGYGTDTGARGRLGWENRRINDRGHRFRADYQLSEINESLSTRYTWPIRDPRTDEIALSTSWSDEHPDVSRSETFQVRLSHTVARSSKWLESLYLKYLTESYQVADDSGDSVLLIPGVTYSRVSADKRSYPSRGLRLLFDLSGATPELISDHEFVQLRMQAKGVASLGARHRFIARGDVGTTFLDPIRSLPTSLRYFAGGSQSVRGYAYDSLAPRNDQGQVVGGEHLLVGSLEYEYRFAEKWSGALFFDTGNAINDWQEPLKQGAGVGLRWISPVGPVRLDLAWAVSEPGAPIRVHLNVGPDL